MQRVVTICLGLLIAVLPRPAAAQPASSDQILSAPSAADVQARTLEWVASRGIKDAQLLEQIGQLWADESGTATAGDRLRLVIETFGRVDPEVHRLTEQCVLVDAPIFPPQIDGLLEKYPDDAFFANQMNLFYGRYLAQRKMYDEAWEVLSELDPTELVDPASSLFYRAVAEHQLLMKDEGLATLEQLLSNTEDVPVAYSSVASLMQYELQNLKQKSLEEITRMMSDVERRLDLGRGGAGVQKKEQEVIALLDELIEKIEQSQGGGGGGGAGGGNQPSGPADDSSVGGQTGPGEVDNKDIGRQNGWGALPPKEEARAKQDIARKFPPQYIEAINKYNRKLANRRANSGR